jgi:hypothetical protein
VAKRVGGMVEIDKGGKPVGLSAHYEVDLELHSHGLDRVGNLIDYLSQNDSLPSWKFSMSSK